jgi:hypothetical protein
MNYDASSIRILSEIERDVFNFHLIAKLKLEYPNYPAHVIEIGIEACRRASIDTNYFVERYLKGNKEIPLNSAVESAYSEIKQEHALRAR